MHPSVKKNNRMIVNLILHPLNFLSFAFDREDVVVFKEKEKKNKLAKATYLGPKDCNDTNGKLLLFCLSYINQHLSDYHIFDTHTCNNNQISKGSICTEVNVNFIHVLEKSKYLTMFF